MIPPEAIFIIARFIIAWGSGVLVARGWAPAATDQVITAETQVVLGVISFIGVTGYGVWRRRRQRQIADVAGMAGVSTIHAEPALAASLQAQGVTNVVAAPPAQP